MTLQQFAILLLCISTTVVAIAVIQLARGLLKCRREVAALREVVMSLALTVSNAVKRERL